MRGSRGSSTWTRLSSCLAILVSALSNGAATSAETLTAIVFNVESSPSEETDPRTVAGDLKEALRSGTLPRAEIWGFAEVGGPKSAGMLRTAVNPPGGKFKMILGRSAVYTDLEDDRLAIAYDSARLELRELRELEYVRLQRGANRAPLVAVFRTRRPGAKEFAFVMNHLRRTEPEERYEQARLLNRWGRELGMPAIVAGDFNFDWMVESGKHDRAYEALTRGDVFRWVRPDSLVATKCGSRAVLDFVFVGGAAKEWKGSSTIHFGERDICKLDPLGYSDHRPVGATFEIPESP